MGAELSQFAAQAAGSVATGAVNSMFAKSLMEDQWRYQKQMFNMENERQNWLMLNSQAMQKAALQKAGYSTADPQGTGVQTPATSNGDTPTIPGAMAGDIRFDPVGVHAQMKQADYYEAQKDLAMAEAAKAKEEAEGIHLTNQYIMPRNQAELDKICAEIDKMQKDGNLSEVEADVRKKLAESTCKLNAKQCEEIDQKIKNAQEEINRIREQVNLLKAQQKTESAQQGYYKNASYAQFQQGELTKKQGFGQDWLNKGYKFNAAISYLEAQEKDVKLSLRRDLADLGVDLDEHNITTLIGKGVLIDSYRGTKSAVNGIPPGAYGIGEYYRRSSYDNIKDLRFE